MAKTSFSKDDWEIYLNVYNQKYSPLLIKPEKQEEFSQFLHCLNIIPKRDFCSQGYSAAFPAEQYNRPVTWKRTNTIALSSNMVCINKQPVHTLDLLH